MTVTNIPFPPVAYARKKGLSPKEAQPTWEKLVALEPELNDLLSQAKRHQGCAVEAWYGPGGLRAAITRMVGWRRQVGPVALQQSVAYDIVYQRIWNALPDCEGCSC